MVARRRASPRAVRGRTTGVCWEDSARIPARSGRLCDSLGDGGRSARAMGACSRKWRWLARVSRERYAPLHLEVGNTVEEDDNRLVRGIALRRAGLACLLLGANAQRLRANRLCLIPALAEFHGPRCAGRRRLRPGCGRRCREERGKETKQQDTSHRPAPGCWPATANRDGRHRQAMRRDAQPYRARPGRTWTQTWATKRSRPTWISKGASWLSRPACIRQGR